jgi:hypothetical protein
MSPNLGSSLDSPLTSFNLNPASKKQLFAALWQIGCSEQDFLLEKDDLRALLRFYTIACKFALTDEGRHLWAKTHRDVLNISEEIWLGRDRKSIHQWLETRIPNPKPSNTTESIANSIDLAGRLLTMIGIGKPSFGFIGYDELIWEDGSLRDSIHHYFNESRGCSDNVRLERVFNVRNLERLASVKIELG